MRKIYLILILTIVWQFGCGSEAATNGNSTVNSNKNTITNEQNQNGNSKEITNANQNVNVAEEEEEVPTFDDAEAALKKGEEYLENNKTEEAINALKQATELDSDLSNAHFQLGVAYSLQESEEDAKVVPLDEDPTKKPKKKKAPKKRNSELSFENAVKAYKKYIRKNPKDAEASYNLGRAYNKLGSEKDKDARKALERAVRLDGKNSLYRTELAAVLIELAKYPDAIRQLNKAVELDEDNARAEDLLVKARAGKKRTNFKKKDKK